MPDPVARPEVERVRERIEAFDISPTFDAKGSYSTRKSAEWATLRDEILAYLRAVEGERDDVVRHREAILESFKEYRHLAQTEYAKVKAQLQAYIDTVVVRPHQWRALQDTDPVPMPTTESLAAILDQLAARTPTPKTVERVARDGVYLERNRLVAALAKIYPASLERHPDSDTTWDDDWRWIVFIDLPTGQASWHLHDSHLDDFAHVPRFQGRVWDGHTTEEKYRRLAALRGGGGVDMAILLAVLVVCAWAVLMGTLVLAWQERRREQTYEDRYRRRWWPDIDF